MIREAIELIQETACDAASVGKVVELDRVRYLWNGSEFQEVPKLPEPREHHVHDLDSFLLACEKYGEDGSVWHSHGSVMLLIDDTARYEFVTLVLTYSPQWESYARCGERTYSPGEARAFLLRKLAGCVADGLPARFGRVSFSRKSDGRSDVDHQKESLGRTVESEVSATDDIPEVINCSIPVYSTLGIRDALPVSLSCDVRFDTEAFSLAPVVGDVEFAMSVIQSRLSELLATTNLPVFHGTP